MQKTQLTKSLGPWGAASLVVGTIIGTGIFIKTASMTQTLGSMTLVLMTWILAGILSYAGALTYAELMSNHPKAGGEYALLKKGYGELPAFLYGWMRFWIGSPGSIAAYAVGSATFLKGLSFPLIQKIPTSALGISFILFFSFLNCFKLSFGSAFQTFLTFLKVSLIILLSIIFLSYSSELLPPQTITHEPPSNWLSAFGMAMIAALWAYDGWNNLPMVAEEMEKPEKNIPLSLGLGVLAIIILYGLLNYSFFQVLSFDEVYSSHSKMFPNALPVATEAASKILGPIGVPLLSFAFVLSALGAMNGSILTSSRVPFAMSRDKLFFKSLAKIHPSSQVPVVSIIVQSLIACLLALSGTFDQLTDYVVICAWIFYALTASLVFKWRSNSSSHYKTPFYPLLPLLFVLTSIFLVGNSLWNQATEALIGIGIILAGVLFYYYFKKTRHTL